MGNTAYKVSEFWNRFAVLVFVKPQYDEFTKSTPSRLVICGHCERVYWRGYHVSFGGHKYCPYKRCSGSAETDIYDWRIYSDYNKQSRYPVIGQRYPLHEYFAS